MKTNGRYLRTIFIASITILLVSLLRVTDLEDFWPNWTEATKDICSFALYFALMAVWGISAGRHIMHARIRKNLIAMAVLVGMWLITRELKWRYVQDVNIERYLWYSYYIPMILIPLFGFQASRYIGKSEDEGIKTQWNLLHLIALILILLVFTNDLHGLVFHIPDLSNTRDYTHGVGYFLCVGWMLTFMIAMIVVMLRRTNTSGLGRKKFLPFLIILVGILYFVLFIIPVTSQFVGTIDIASMYAWITIVSWETLVYLGLVPVNSFHKDFFLNSSLRSQIVDEAGRPYLMARNAVTLDNRTFNELKSKGTLYYNERTQLQLYPISCGYMLWQEDIGQINRMIEELVQNSHEMKERNTLAEEEYRAEIRAHKIEEKNRIYSELAQETKSALERMMDLSRKLYVADCEETAYDLLSKINVLGVYVKRKSNFLMISENSQTIPPEELELCLMEIQRNLSLCKMEFTYEIRVERGLLREEIFSAYDSLELILEEIIGTAHALHVTFSDETRGMLMQITMPGVPTISVPFVKGGATG